MVDREGLLERLRSGELVSLAADDFEALSAAITVTRTVDTGLAGPLHVLHESGLWAIVEFPPGTNKAAVRPLPDAAAAEAFVAERLATYERMWDGCGCRPDYWGT